MAGLHAQALQGFPTWFEEGPGLSDVGLHRLSQVHGNSGSFPGHEVRQAAPGQASLPDGESEG